MTEPDIKAADRLDNLAVNLIGEAFFADWHDDPDKGVREVQRIKDLFVRKLNEFACDEISRDRDRRPAASGDLRERIARIVDPLAAELRTALDDAVNEPPELRRIAEAKWETRNAAALAKADAILASLPCRDDEAIRVEERERCARLIETTQETIRETDNGSERYLAPRMKGNLLGLAFADGVRTLKTERGS